MKLKQEGEFDEISHQTYRYDSARCRKVTFKSEARPDEQKTFPIKEITLLGRQNNNVELRTEFFSINKDKNNGYEGLCHDFPEQYVHCKYAGWFYIDLTKKSEQEIKYYFDALNSIQQIPKETQEKLNHNIKKYVFHAPLESPLAKNDKIQGDNPLKTPLDSFDLNIGPYDLNILPISEFKESSGLNQSEDTLALIGDHSHSNCIVM